MMVVLLLKELDLAGTPFRPQKSKGNGKQNKTDKNQIESRSQGSPESYLYSDYNSSEHQRYLNLVKRMLKLNIYKI